MQVAGRTYGEQQICCLGMDQIDILTDATVFFQLQSRPGICGRPEFETRRGADDESKRRAGSHSR